MNIMKYCQNTIVGKKIQSFVQHWDYNKYWKRRSIVIDSLNKTNIIRKLYFLYWIKKIDAYHNCSFGTNLNSGAKFITPPILPHGPNGIIVGHDCIIGRNVVIYHQVTIMHGEVRLGDNVMLGAGSKILPRTIIGNNVRVGANCVVGGNIPDDSTVVLPKSQIILH